MRSCTGETNLITEWTKLNSSSLQSLVTIKKVVIFAMETAILILVRHIRLELLVINY